MNFNKKKMKPGPNQLTAEPWNVQKNDNARSK